jgi:hypothetical protein
LLFPVLWLLFNRLWVEAAVAFALFLASAMMIANPLCSGRVWHWAWRCQHITALEGRNWRAAALVRRGWQMVDLIEADDADTAFEIHALQAPLARLRHARGQSHTTAGCPADSAVAVRATPARSALCRFKGVESDAGCGG